MTTATDTTAGATQSSGGTTAATATGQTEGSASTTQGAATSAAADAAGQTGAAGTTDGAAQTGDEAPWQDGLAGDLKTNPLFRTYKTVDDLAKAHDHLTKLKGATAAELLKIPAKPQDQAPEDWAPIHKALGVPEDPKDYKITLAPEAAADAPALEGVLRELGGKAKFQPAQMAAVIETLNTLGQQAEAAEVAAREAETRTVTDTLNKEWGAAAEGNRRAIGKLMRDALGGQIDEAAQADLERTVGANLTLSRILAHAIGKMAEPEGPEGGSAAPAARQLSPAGAQAALNALQGDAEKMKALNDRGHPQHKAVLEERRHLLAQARGEKRPDSVG
ncbi:hypothetical protein [Brevundimonas sp.]|uniref:hypothetical protein n=1 Tax=Brevundimonas sp. TaxID=1871086 RepID=UPI00289E3450|nr:hypothetical protein [Brevundimonas sp.]